MLAGIGAFVGLRMEPRGAVAAWRWRLARSRSARWAWRSARSRARCARPRCWPSCSRCRSPSWRSCPRARWRAGLYDVIRAISLVFPYKAALQALDAAVNRSSPGLGVSLAHLLVLTALFAVLARLGLRRRGVRRGLRGDPGASEPRAGVSSTAMAFPQTRMRRLRASPALRGLVRETELRAGQLVLPLFVEEDPAPAVRSRRTNRRRVLPAARAAVDRGAVEEARAAAAAGDRGGAAVRDPRREGRARAPRRGMRRAWCSCACARSSGSCRSCW